MIFKTVILAVLKAVDIFYDAFDLYEAFLKSKGRRGETNMRFHYKYFEPNIGDLIVDTHDGTTGIIIHVGEWHYLSYNRSKGMQKRAVITVTMPEYNNYSEQFNLKCYDNDGYKTIISEVKFMSRDDLVLLDIEI
tara:strand:- start:92 stop:496 length:405 start_codon:yes stop_codon:yes gene_type:complete